MDINLDDTYNSLRTLLSSFETWQIAMVIITVLFLLYKIVSIWRQWGQEEVAANKEQPFTELDTDVLAQRLFNQGAQNFAGVAPNATMTEWQPNPVLDEPSSLTPETPETSATPPQTISRPELFWTLPADLYPVIDYIVFLTPSVAISVSDLTTHLQQYLQDYTKSVFVYVLDNSHANVQWQRLNKASMDLQVIRLALSIQLANRDGPLTASDLERWRASLEQLSRVLDAELEGQQHTDDVLESARELDALCMEVDKTISLYLVADEGSPFAGTKLKGLAEAHGFAFNRGVFTYVTQNETPYLALFNHGGGIFDADALRGDMLKSVVLSLDIPHARDASLAFQQMLHIARQMATSLNGKLTDAKHEPLQDAKIDKIYQQIKHIHNTMLAHKMVPGSACASRLFS